MIGLDWLLLILCKIFLACLFSGLLKSKSVRSCYLELLEIDVKNFSSHRTRKITENKKSFVCFHLIPLFSHCATDFQLVRRSKVCTWQTWNFFQIFFFGKNKNRLCVCLSFIIIYFLFARIDLFEKKNWNVTFSFF